MAFNLRRIDKDKFEYINKAGETKYFTKANLDKFLADGKELIVDGQPYTGTIQQPSQPQVQDASQEKKNNFITTDNENFSYNGKQYPKAVIINNLAKGVKLFVNNKPIKLSQDGKNFEYIEQPKSPEKPFDVSKSNIEAAVSAAPADAVPIIAINVIQDKKGRYFYKNKETTKEAILNTLLHGKNVSINGKLLQLTENKKGFEFVPEPEPEPKPEPQPVEKTIEQKQEEVAKQIASKPQPEPVQEQKPQPQPSQPKVFALTTIDENNFFYPVKNLPLKRAQVLKNLKKGLLITIDGRPIKLTPDGLDFGFADEIEALAKAVKPIEEVQSELANHDAQIINVKKSLPSYFNDDVSIDKDSYLNKKDSIKVSESFKKMKDLQKRLFSLSGDSNMINVENDIAKTFDFARFINDFEHHTKEHEIFKRMLAGENIIFPFTGTSDFIRKTWSKMMKFSSLVSDTYKEMGDDYLFIGYPSIEGDIPDKTNELNETIHINAPLFLVKAKFVLNAKDKNLTFLFAREKQQLMFQANKELLLYLATKLDKTINLAKYKILFDQTFHAVEDQINAIVEFFKDLDLSFNKELVLNCIDKYNYEESKITFTFDKSVSSSGESKKPVMKKHPKPVKSKKKKEESEDSSPVFTKQGQVQQSEQSVVSSSSTLVEAYPHCYIGVFKTLNCEIFKDYDKILEKEEGREYWAGLDSRVPDQLNYFVKMGEDFKESDLRQIVPLDYSQKVACNLAINDSINIVGPAGTGKSQTISNIIANYIDKHESALFVAEKKTATDVVFNRLRNLRYYCLPLFDKENWNETLTKALRQTLKRVGSIYGSWSALELDDVENQEGTASATLDEQFEKMKKFRKLMTGKEGYALPKLNIKFSEPKMAQQLKDVELVQSEFDAAKTADEFWKAIDGVKLERRLLAGCEAMLRSITDKEFQDNDPLINKFFKACKYAFSPTFENNELVQILQGEYTDKPVDPKVEILDGPELNAYKQTDNLYKKVAQLINDMKVSHASTLNDIKKAPNFITISYLKQLRAKVDSLKSINPQMSNPNVPPGFGQQQTGGNPYIVNGVFVNPQQPQNPYMQHMIQNGQQQYASNMPVQGQPQPNQQPPYGQQPVNQPPYGQQPIQNQQIIGPNAQPYPQQMIGPNGQVVQMQPQQQIPQDPVLYFAQKYNADNFAFAEIKQYIHLNKEWKLENETSELLKLQPTAWFKDQTRTMTDKIKLDLTFSELSFLRYVRNQINSNMVYAAQYNKLYGIVDNCTKLDDVEEVLNKFGAIIALLYPIVIASPNLVSKYLQPKNELFNHVVIDEASMLSLEKAIPILYRGKKFCVVGDSKQLQPLSYLEQLKKLDLYKKLYLEEKIKKDDLLRQQRLVNEYKGVLDFIGQKIQKTTLQYHYRSAKKDIVRFSSVAFYDNEMITANNYSERSMFDKCGVFVNQVNGEYKKGINQLECKALYDELVKIARKNRDIIDIAKKTSVGIIVFTTEQKDFLNNMIAEKADPDVLNMQVMFNQETGEDNSLFIKDVESVQGDERDIILMSLGSSTKNKTEMISSFGLLNTDLGPNFLNVMITRARQALIVFKSFVSQDVPNTGNSAINVYRDFIKYIDLLAQNDPENTKNQIDNLFKEYILRSATIDYSSLSFNMNESYLGQELLPYFSKYINQNKYTLVKDYPTIQGQKFGLVALNKETNLPEFALIFDDFIKNLYKTAKQSEYYDYQFLLSRGWQFHKITSLDWANLLSQSKAEEKEKNIIEFIKKQLQFDKVNYFDDQWQNDSVTTKTETVTTDANGTKKVVKKTVTISKPTKKTTKKKTTKKVAKKPKAKVEKFEKTTIKKTIVKKTSTGKKSPKKSKK